MNQFLSTCLIIFLVCAKQVIVYGQTGISYFMPSDAELTNSNAVSISQANNGNLMLLILNSDPNYLSHSLQILNKPLNISDITKSDLVVNNLHDLVSIELKGINEYAIFGNTTVNKSFEPFQLNISGKGEVLSDIQLPQVYSTLISDVIVHNESFMILYSKVGKNNLYNISLHKVNAENGNVEWLKVISSENNEEADKIVATPSGEFYVLGKKYNDEVTEFVPIIYKIDKNGKQLWKKAIDVPSNFNKQSILSLNNEELLYVCGYTKNPTGFSETRVLKLSNTGEEMEGNSLKDFSANGIIEISNESFLIYGSKFIVNTQQIVTKGKFVILDKKLVELAEKTLDENDKPDVLLKTKTKTSSDFLCAKKLMDNKIALAGKVFVPTSNNIENKINVPLLMIINKDGTYEK
jgi:hypothetical protein